MFNSGAFSPGSGIFNHNTGSFSQGTGAFSHNTGAFNLIGYNPNQVVFSPIVPEIIGIFDANYNLHNVQLENVASGVYGFVSEIYDDIAKNRTEKLNKYFTLISKYSLYKIMCVAVEDKLISVVEYMLRNNIYYYKLEMAIYERNNTEVLSMIYLITKYKKQLNRCFNIAVLYGNSEVALYLLKYTELDPNMKNKNNESRIHEIVRLCNESYIDTYVHYDVSINEVNNNNDTPLMLAIKLKMEKHIAKLLYYNCDVTVVNNDGKTALDLAHEYDINFELIHKISMMKKSK